MANVLFMMPLHGNGGIKAWAQKLVENFPYHDITFLPVDTSHVELKSVMPFRHYVQIALTMHRIMHELKQVISTKQVDVVHATTSGAMGSLRDILVGRYLRRKGIKSILHCHYGCVVADYRSKGFFGKLLRRSLALYDQIWVLEGGIRDFLSKQPGLEGKVFLTPNSIEVSEPMDSAPKSYHRVAFVGNLEPTKGIYELVKAVVRCPDTRLDVVGPGTDEVNEHIRQLAGDAFDKSIYLHGRLPNKEAVQFMKSVDIVALPTYFRAEAFPISILEAMSLSKMVVSTRRAAIPDMLTALDGTECGLMVPEQSVEGIEEAIKFCQTHPKEADAMCRKAYEKVYNTYRKEKVFELYYDLYSKLTTL